ncbi:hypothetical protein D9757_012174 [Collybiopsis confluens]|uniref:Uncharacterized protein n=1 Tax=Collybiopsis confluens TaxID=2823264 RepID=A0A8H5GKA8_9AGAR|nr:hypothetical protein D9757_012174 [Collybiopsis confluens]
MVVDQVIAFNAVECLGLVGALVILITSVLPPARSTPRLSMWYMVLASSGFYNLAMLLLAIARAQSGPQPNFTLCLAQSALIYSAPIWLMGSVCTFAFQLHLAVLYYAKHYTGWISHESPWLPAWIVALFFAVTVMLLIIAGANPEIVRLNEEHFYCHFTNHIGTITVTVFGVLFAVVAVTCEVKSGMILYRSRKSSSDLHRASNGRVSFGVFLRLAGFSLNSILSVTLCALFVLSNENNSFGYFNIFVALVGSADVPLLGLNNSIIRTWMFWRKRTETVETVEAGHGEKAGASTV